MMRIALLTLLATLGCQGNKEEPFRLMFASESDPGQPLGGVRVTVDDAPIGETAANGFLEVSLDEKPGTRLVLGANCPDGYQQARLVPTLTLRRLRSLASGPDAGQLRVPITCAPTHRTAALVVRAEGRAGVPIVVNGRELARTDKNGVAHVAIRSLPYDNLRVVLDTRTFPSLMPQDPELSFQIGESDEIFIFDQAFIDKPVRKPLPRKLKAKPTRPQKIG